MSRATKLTVHGYGDSGGDPDKATPLVQMLFTTEHGDVNDLCFHPDDAGAIIGAILAASTAAGCGGPKVEALINVTLKFEVSES
jgi:hypothetical protein